MSQAAIKFKKPDATPKFPVEFRKFGGSSFKPLSNVDNIAGELINSLEQGVKQVVFCSAPSGLTDQFQDMAAEISDAALSPAQDGLVMASDLVGALLLQHALHGKGVKNRVLSGLENGIHTVDGIAGSPATNIDANAILDVLQQVDVCILPGGQGAFDNQLRWLGKNSSDLSCVLTAIASDADEAAIHSDVDSVFSADPNVLAEAKPYQQIDYDTVITAANLGAKVLHPVSVRSAQEANVDVVCKLNKPPFGEGTRIGNYAPGVIIVSDKKAQLISCLSSDLPAIEAALTDINVTYFTACNLSVLSPEQVLIPIAYSNYGAWLQEKLPEANLNVQGVTMVHAVSGTEVKESRFVQPDELNDAVTALHQEYVTP